MMMMMIYNLYIVMFIMVYITNTQGMYTPI
jgi:hypothetical protein